MRKDGALILVSLSISPVRDARGEVIGAATIAHDITAQAQAEEELQGKERLQRLALSVGRVGAFDVDLASGRGTWTPELKEIWGIPDDFAGDLAAYCWGHAHPEDVDRVRDEFARLSQSGDATEMEFRIIRPDGETRWIRWLGQVVLDADTGLPHALGVNLDITERKQAEEALRRSEEHFHSIVTAMDEGVVFQRKSGEITSVNPAAERILGLPVEQLMGQTSDDRVQEAEIIREDGSPFPGELRPAMVTLRTGKPQSKVVMGVRRPDDSFVWISVNSQPLVASGESEPRAVVTTFRDITEHRQADARLRERDADLARSQAIAHLGGWSWDIPTDTVTWSEETYRIYGVDPADFDGRMASVIALIHPDDREMGHEVLAAVLRGEVVDAFENRIVRPDGQERVVMIRGASVERDTAGEPARFFGVVMDVTERRRAEDQVRAASLYARSLIEASLDPLVTISPEGKITDVNEATIEATGVARDQLIGTDFADYFTGPQDARDGYLRAFEEGLVRDYPLAIRSVSGDVTDVLYNAAIYRDEAGDAVGVFAAARDVSERSRAEEALRESEARFRSLFEDSPIAMWEEDHSAVKVRLEQLQADGVEDVAAYLRSHPDEYRRCIQLARAIDVNHAAVKLFAAADKQELLERADELHGLERPGSLCLFWEALMAGERLASYEETNVTLAGESIELLETCTLAPGCEDSWSRVYVVDADVTERMQAEEEVRRHAEQLRRTVEGAVLAMSHLVESRDPYTAGHERRVAALATAIAVELGMTGEDLAALRLAATIHDVGKIAVPAEILAKPGLLSEVEFSLVKVHPATGFDVLADVDFGRPVAEMVLQHHERLDGSGYPRGLAGAEIMLQARILAVADVVEAMASHRPYRAALGMEAALAEVREHAGVKYDADVVAACLRLVEERGFQFPS